jgi:hypothetical protein
MEMAPPNVSGIVDLSGRNTMSGLDGAWKTRLRRVEDQLAIYQIISAFNAAADSTNIDLAYELWDENCELILMPPGTLNPNGGSMPSYGTNRGHEGVRDVMMGEHHQMLVTKGSGHINSLPHVEIEGDLASATTYQTLFLFKDGQFVLDRLHAARWELIRTKHGWRIARRVTEAMQAPNQGALNLLRRIRQVR